MIRVTFKDFRAIHFGAGYHHHEEAHRLYLLIAEEQPGEHAYIDRNPHFADYCDATDHADEEIA